MARIGTTKNAKQAITKKIQNHPDLIINTNVGDLAYRIADPATKLITMIGSSFFNEPSYYGGNAKDSKDLTDKSRDVIKTAAAVANSDNPEDLWVICKWAREELHMRTTPNVLAAIGCKITATKPWARVSIPAIAQRADEPLHIFAAYTHLFGKPLPNSLKRGLSDTLAKKSEWEHIRYSDSAPGVHPNTKDMLLMVARKGDWPIKKELFNYLVNGELSNPEVIPVAAAHAAIAQCTKFNDVAKALVLAARSPWEVVLSKFGNTTAVWEFLINNNLLGYMALLRNLRNIENAKVHTDCQKLIREKLIKGAVTSKQLPFRFLAARQNISENWTRSAIDLAFNESIVNTPILTGKTLIVVDQSGSMRSPVSDKSTMMCDEVAQTLAAILAKRCGAENVTIYAFADRTKEVGFSDADSVMAIVERIKKTSVGSSTYAHLPIQVVSALNQKFDRIIILSDMQCYTSNVWDYNDTVKLDEAVKLYRNKVNHDVFIHSIDLHGYGTAVVDPKDKKVQLLGGWSENIFKLIESFEGVETGSGIPTIEALRSKYSLINK